MNRLFFSGWIMIVLSICCVSVYISGNKLWADIPNMIMGWWLFAAGFFIAGILMIMHEPGNQNRKGY